MPPRGAIPDAALTAFFQELRQFPQDEPLALMTTLAVHMPTRDLLAARGRDHLRALAWLVAVLWLGPREQRHPERWIEMVRALARSQDAIGPEEAWVEAFTEGPARVAGTAVRARLLLAQADETAERLGVLVPEPGTRRALPSAHEQLRRATESCRRALDESQQSDLHGERVQLSRAGAIADSLARGDLRDMNAEVSRSGAPELHREFLAAHTGLTSTADMVLIDADWLQLIVGDPRGDTRAMYDTETDLVLWQAEECSEMLAALPAPHQMLCHELVHASQPRDRRSAEGFSEAARGLDRVVHEGATEAVTQAAFTSVGLALSRGPYDGYVRFVLTVLEALGAGTSLDDLVTLSSQPQGQRLQVVLGHVPQSRQAVLRGRLEAFVHPRNRLTRIELILNGEGPSVFEELAHAVRGVATGT